VVDPSVEGGLLIVTRFDVERRLELQVWIGSGSIFDGVDEPPVERCLLVVASPCPSPLEESSISIGLCPILVDAVVPLRMRDVIWGVPE
jgi:hypothetical protein